MNCDQAFDVMTSHRRASDRALPVHLAGCPRCREMQVTLEPALGMFQADTLLSQHTHPWEVASEGNEVATQSARRLSASSSAPRQRPSGLWGYAAAVVLGAGLVFCTILLNPPAALAPAVQYSQQDCLYLADARPTGMTSRQMTQSCLACHTMTDRP